MDVLKSAKLVRSNVIKYLLALLVLASSAYPADNGVFIDLGLGALDTQGVKASDVKFLKVGKEYTLNDSLAQRVALGGWQDLRDNGNNSSAFINYQIGLVAQNSLLEASIFVGPTLISAADTSLGGLLQFNETVFLGVRGQQGMSLGFSYNHFSNAGITQPNVGKDFMGVGFKFSM